MKLGHKSTTVHSCMQCGACMKKVEEGGESDRNQVNVHTESLQKMSIVQVYIFATYYTRVSSPTIEA